LAGNLSKNNLRLRPHNYPELSRGVWNMRISHCVVDNATSEEYCAGISSNLVKGYKSSNSGQTTAAYSILILFLLPRNSKQVINFTSGWHCINNYNEEMVINIVDLKTQEKLTIDCDVYMNIQFQRIQ
jgi:hypothetical protein